MSDYEKEMFDIKWDISYEEDNIRRSEDLIRGYRERMERLTREHEER